MDIKFDNNGAVMKTTIVLILLLATSLYAQFPAEEVWSVELDTTVTCFGPHWEEDGQFYFLMGGSDRIWIVSEGEIVSSIDNPGGITTALNRIDFGDGEGPQIIAGTFAGRILVYSGEDHNLLFNEQLMIEYNHDDDFTSDRYNGLRITNIDFFESMRVDDDRRILISNVYSYYEEGYHSGQSRRSGAIQLYSFSQNHFTGIGSGGRGTEMCYNENNGDTILISGYFNISFNWEIDSGAAYGGTSCGIFKISENFQSTSIALEAENWNVSQPGNDYVDILGYTVVNGIGNGPKVAACHAKHGSITLSLVNVDELRIENQRSLQRYIVGMEDYAVDTDGRDPFIIGFLSTYDENGDAFCTINPENLRMADVFPGYQRDVKDFRIDQFDDDPELEMLLLRGNQLSMLDVLPLSVPSYGEAILKEFNITAAYPNPFNSEAIIEYSLNIPGNYDLTVHDLTGREVTRLARGWQNIGSHQTVWDARGLGSGTYLIRLDGGMDQSMKVVNLVK